MKEKEVIVLRLVLLVLLGTALAGMAQGPVEELLSQADALYDCGHGNFEFTEYEARLREAISIWEGVLPLLNDRESRRAVLVKLSRAWFELAEGYLQKDQDKEAAYKKGKDYGLSALRLDGGFVLVEGKEGFRAALQTASDVEALFWYGNNLGRWLAYHYWEALTGGTRDVFAAFARCAELDESYWAGGPRRALANFLAQTPGFLGGDLQRAKTEFQRALELAPHFLQNYVDYAEHWAKKVGDSALFCSLVEEALRRGAEPEVFWSWPFYNTLALRRAGSLRQECR
ncbi:MAG: TRAP transporter TatT component family protein [Candidatus Bipolaricaulota bacterium]|nr:TRAP transporter TatT component family protein [Candidatus Bipolaricaulota bacterium]MDW8126179.1 TRAP transporter TatT component family protein [Candidatus Bipolaricaulota bacterium]